MSDAVNKIYCNSFVVKPLQTDFLIEGELNGNKIQELNLSYTTIKSLAECIGKAIQKFEEAHAIEDQQIYSELPEINKSQNTGRVDRSKVIKVQPRMVREGLFGEKKNDSNSKKQSG